MDFSRKRGSQKNENVCSPSSKYYVHTSYSKQCLENALFFSLVIMQHFLVSSVFYENFIIILSQYALFLNKCFRLARKIIFASMEQSFLLQISSRASPFFKGGSSIHVSLITNALCKVTPIMEGCLGLPTHLSREALSLIHFF